MPKSKRRRKPVRAANPGALRITFQHRPGKDRWQCGCGKVGKWTNDVKVAQFEATLHASWHASNEKIRRLELLKGEDADG